MLGYAVTADPDYARQRRPDRAAGTGAFADCARGLTAVAGMRHAIEQATDAGTPFLGICVGMQLMAERGLEHEITPGFGWIGGEIAEMAAPGLAAAPDGLERAGFRSGQSQILLDGLTPGDHAYFVHSYALVSGDPAEAIAMTDYGGPVVAMVAERQLGRHAISRREEPGGRHPHSQQLPALDALTRMADDAPPLLRHSAWSSASPKIHRRRSAPTVRGDLGGDHRRRRLRLGEPAGHAGVRDLFPRRAAGAGAGALSRETGRHWWWDRRIWCARRATTRRRDTRRNSMHAYIAPYARGHGLARMLTIDVEDRRA